MQSRGTLRLAVLALTASAAALALELPTRHGVVFFCPETAAEAVQQLESIRRDGFRLVIFASWIWTLPTPGSDLERRAQAVLEWCDRHEMSFFLLHNIQYGGEAGGLDREVLEPELSLPLLADWARVLRGHPSVAGVILGNEVTPALGTPEQAPRLWDALRLWLRDQHESIARLNRAWGTAYDAFAAVGVPAAQSPGWVDCRRYARQRFVEFYGLLVERGLRPQLGDLLYGNKTALDPFLQRACLQMTVACWDDVLAQYPVWEIKCAADTCGKPLFNGELHLYHDTYQFFPSPEQSSYRYHVSALLGETLTASFAWGQWQKPEIQAVHAATPPVLAEVGRLDPLWRQVAAAARRAELRVLVTEDAYYRPRLEGEREHPLARLHARMNALGTPWRYLLETDLETVDGGTLVVWTRGLAPARARELGQLPAGVRLLAVDSVPDRDEYGRPLAEDAVAALRTRLQVVPLADLAQAIGVAPGLPPAYQRLGTVAYWAWAEKRGHFQYEVPCCLLEAHRVETPEGTLVAVVNNTPEVQSGPIPWAGAGAATDMLSGRSLEARELENSSFAPLAVRLFRLR